MNSPPKLPRAGVMHPPGEFEDRLHKVKTQPPEDYLKIIQNLISEAKEYELCLNYQGYYLEGFDIDQSNLKAKKTIVIG